MVDSEREVLSKNGDSDGILCARPGGVLAVNREEERRLRFVTVCCSKIGAIGRCLWKSGSVEGRGGFG
jgi:hypothetical protein